MQDVLLEPGSSSREKYGACGWMLLRPWFRLAMEENSGGREFEASTAKCPRLGRYALELETATMHYRETWLPRLPS